MTGTLKTASFIATLSLTVLCLAAPLLAADGVLIVETTTRNGKAATNQVQIEKTRMRAETVSANGGKQVFTFDGTAQMMRIIDMEKKTYSEITKAEVDQMAGQMKAAMDQMQEQMKNMPPAARAQMEAMMSGRGTAPAKTEYKKTGTDKVGKWTCDKYEGYQGDKKVSDLCTVDPKTLGFVAADFEVTKQLAAFFQQLIPQNVGQMFTLGQSDQQGFSGVPVRRAYTVVGTPLVTEMTEVSRQNFPDAIFAVPAGFEKTASPFAGAARGGRGR